MDLPIGPIKEGIDRGTILHSSIFKDIDHGKFFVVIGINKESIAGFFFVNSNIHKSIFGKPEQLAMQYPIRHADYSFLKYDSFVCATNIIRIPFGKLAASITAGDTRIVGMMLKEHIEELLQAARQSPLFSPIEKKSFLY